MSLIQVIDPLVLNECAKLRRQAATSLFVGEQVQTKGILSSIHERGICGVGSCALEYVAKRRGRNFFRRIKNLGKIRMILSKRGHPLIVFERFDVPLTTLECLIAVSVCTIDKIAYKIQTDSESLENSHSIATILHIIFLVFIQLKVLQNSA